MPYADPKKKAEYSREWSVKNSAHVKEYREQNKELRSTQHREWRQKNLISRAVAQEKYRLRFPGASQMRSRIANFLGGKTKAASTPDLLGCELDALGWYLEAQFQPGMTWENYGGFWEVDHVIPLSWFDQTETDWQYRAFHFSNLQPLTVSENRRKGNRYVV